MHPESRQAQPTDAELLIAARSGNCGCLGLLLERHRPPLHAAALRLLGYSPEAEDAVHETFLIALQRLGELRDPRSVGAWLRVILRHCCLQHLRRRKGEVLMAVLPEVAEERVNAEERLDKLALRDWVWGALQQLPEPLRVAAMLRYFGSYQSYEEIATILAIPIGTVRSRLSQAKLKLADGLLATAGLVDSGARATSDERRRFYIGIFRDLYFGGERNRFLSHFDNDLHLIMPDGAAARGRMHLAAMVEEDAKAGVSTDPQRVLSSGNVAVLEARFINPPENPHHCPPGLALVLFQRDDKAYRLHVHLSPRPPSTGDD